MEPIGVLSADKMHELWYWYQSQKKLQPRLTENLPQRRPIEDAPTHRVLVKNTTAETIPAYACLEVTGTAIVGGRAVVTVQKPTQQTGEFLFNCQYEIKPASDTETGVGWAYRYGVVVMLGDSDYGDIEANSAYQPIVGSWEIEPGGGPFVVFGRHDANDKALIGRFGSQGGGGHTMWFTIVDVHCPDEYDPEKYLVVAPDWYTGQCGAEPPGSNGDGTWNVYDICNYQGDQVDDDLPGTTGRASYFYPYNPYSSSDCLPRWIVSDLCGMPECA